MLWCPWIITLLLMAHAVEPAKPDHSVDALLAAKSTFESLHRQWLSHEWRFELEQEWQSVTSHGGVRSAGGARSKANILHEDASMRALIEADLYYADIDGGSVGKDSWIFSWLWNQRSFAEIACRRGEQGCNFIQKCLVVRLLDTVRCFEVKGYSR